MVRLFTGCFALWLVLIAGNQTCCGWQGTRLSPLEKFQRDLHRRVLRDQGSRYAVINHKKRAGKKVSQNYQKQLYRLMKKASDIDGDNLTWLKKHLSEHGFPKVSEIGKKSAGEFLLLIVHADRDKAFQKKCLDLMKQMPEQWSESHVAILKIRSSMPPAPTITKKDLVTDTDTGNDTNINTDTDTKASDQKPTESGTESSDAQSGE